LVKSRVDNNIDTFEKAAEEALAWARAQEAKEQLDENLQIVEAVEYNKLIQKVEQNKANALRIKKSIEERLQSADNLAKQEVRDLQDAQQKLARAQSQLQTERNIGVRRVLQASIASLNQTIQTIVTKQAQLADAVKKQKAEKQALDQKIQNINKFIDQRREQKAREEQNRKLLQEKRKQDQAEQARRKLAQVQQFFAQRRRDQEARRKLQEVNRFFAQRRAEQVAPEQGPEQAFEAEQPFEAEVPEQGPEQVFEAEVPEQGPEQVFEAEVPEQPEQAFAEAQVPEQLEEVPEQQPQQVLPEVPQSQRLLQIGTNLVRNPIQVQNQSNTYKQTRAKLFAAFRNL
jgi:chromosome segregation ATPase